MFKNIFCRTNNLADIPKIKTCNVLVYLLARCNWSSEGLIRCNIIAGYRSTSRIDRDDINAAFYVHKHNMYLYLRSKFNPLPDEKNPPYVVWVLVNKKSGEIMTSGCSCGMWVDIYSLCNFNFFKNICDILHVYDNFDSLLYCKNDNNKLLSYYDHAISYFLKAISENLEFISIK